MMTKIAVARILATMTKRAFRKVKIMIRSVIQRLTTEKRTIGMRTNDRQAPVRKRPNIQCDAILIMSRIWVIS